VWRLTALLLGAGVCLGLAVPLGKASIARGVTALSFVLWPSLVAGGLLAAAAAWRHGRPQRLGQLAVFGLIAGFFGYAVPNTLVAWLAAQAGASFSGLAYTLPPVFTLLYLLALRVQRASLPRLAAVAVGLMGAGWLALARWQGGEVSLFAALLIVAIPAVIGVGNTYRALWLPQGTPAEWLGAAVTLAGCALLLPVWIWREGAQISLGHGAAPLLLAQVVAASLGSALFFALQRAAEPVTMSFVGYVMALTAVVVGIAVMNEPLPWELMPASALIAAAFALIVRSPPQPAANP
jgi:drug/metabolite transporter (DMT)-like permease